MRPVAALLAVAAACLLLVGCTETPDVGARRDTGTAQPAPAPEATASSERLAAQKKAAEIADCPPSDGDASVVQGGLPPVMLSCLGGGRDVWLPGLRGKPMLLNVWAQWCGPCRTEAPYLAEVATKDSELMILGVDYVDAQPGLAIEFAQLARWRYPQLADTDKALGAPLQIVGPPQSLFLRPDGTIAYRHSGPFTSAEQIRELTHVHLGVRL